MRVFGSAVSPSGRRVQQSVTDFQIRQSMKVKSLTFNGVFRVDQQTKAV